MRGRIGLITGATSGVGAAIVVERLARGDSIIAVGRSVGRLADLRDATPLSVGTGELLTVSADLSTREGQALLRSAIEASAPDGLDYLVHAAFGHIGEDEGKSISEITQDELIEFLSNSVTLAHLTVQSCLPSLLRKQGSQLVFIVADWGLPQHNILLYGETEEGAVGSEPYVSAKYALTGLASALEVQQDVRVTALYPGVIASAALDTAGQPAFLTLGATDDEVAAAGYSVPEAAIPLSDIVAAVSFALSTSATVKTISIRPTGRGYTGV